MPYTRFNSALAARGLTGGLMAGLLTGSPVALAQSDGWSVVPYLGISQMSDQSAELVQASDLSEGELDVELDSGFTAGLSLRYSYPTSRWTSEVGWEYRSNDATTTTSDGTQLPGGNYASNVFVLNGRYGLTEGQRWTPWVGAGVVWVQEVDLDSEDANGERSFSDSGSVGLQVLAGIDLDLTDRLYLTSELRYARLTGLDLAEEGGSDQGVVKGIDYAPVTL